MQKLDPGSDDVSPSITLRLTEEQLKFVENEAWKARKSKSLLVREYIVREMEKRRGL